MITVFAGQVTFIQCFYVGVLQSTFFFSFFACQWLVGLVSGSGVIDERNINCALHKRL